jgi:putative effector of murein hydrolase
MIDGIPVARRLAFGTVSHGIGTARAATEGEIQGAGSGVAMGAAAMVVSFVAPMLIPMLIHLFK